MAAAAPVVLGAQMRPARMDNTYRNDKSVFGPYAGGSGRLTQQSLSSPRSPRGASHLSPTGTSTPPAASFGGGTPTTPRADQLEAGSAFASPLATNGRDPLHAGSAYSAALRSGSMEVGIEVPAEHEHGTRLFGSPGSNRMHESPLREISEQEKTDRLNFYASIPRTGPAQPQKVHTTGNAWRDVRPHECGITLAQCRQLLKLAQNDPVTPWRQDYTVCDLVELYIKPWTAQSGFSYAMHVNADMPLHANVLVSHAWTQRAEDLFDTLERSVSDDDIMYIAAFSMYLCEDGYGPSVLQQQGQSPKESPLCCVLECIIRNGIARGSFKFRLWHCRYLLELLPSVLSILAFCIFNIPIIVEACIPSFTHCFSYSRADADWKASILKTGYEVCLPLTAVCFACAIACRVALSPARVFNGRLLVVPNRSCDVFTRLLCLHEIFLAKTLHVPVVVASGVGLARGEAASSRTAVCSTTDETLQLTDHLRRMSPGGLEDVDLAIVDTLSTASQILTTRALMAACTCSLMFAAVACVIFIPEPNMLAGRLGLALGVVLAEPYVMLVESRLLVRVKTSMRLKATIFDLPTDALIMGALCTIGIAVAFRPSALSSGPLAWFILYFGFACNSTIIVRSLLTLLSFAAFFSQAWYALARRTSAVVRFLQHCWHHSELIFIIAIMAQLWDTGKTFPWFILSVLPLAWMLTLPRVLLLSVRWACLEQIAFGWISRAKGENVDLAAPGSLRTKEL